MNFIPWKKIYRNVGPAIHLIEVDGVRFVFFPAHFAEISGMKAILLCSGAA
jgi:hypothetical protein